MQNEGYQRQVLEKHHHLVSDILRVCAELQGVCSLDVSGRAFVSVCKFALFWCSESWGG